ncbi:hypothetical protein DMUE_3632 [Dictyocoela muelleri]|nr:hypothetical protein DMUE_3632 [Dictyocoela muelleri]
MKKRTFVTCQLLTSTKGTITFICDRKIKQILLTIYVKYRCIDIEELAFSSLFIQINQIKLWNNLTSTHLLPEIIENINQTLINKRITMNYHPKVFMFPICDEFEQGDQTIIVATEKGVLYLERFGDEFDYQEVIYHVLKACSEY